MSLSARHTLGEPTADDLRRWRDIKEAGCIIARMRGLGFVPCEIHHLTLGGKHGAPRLGHFWVVGLSPWSHRGVISEVDGIDPSALAECAEFNYGPSYARTPRAFRREYGNDQQLLDYQQDLLGLPRIVIPTRRPKATMTTVREQQEARGPSGNKGRRRSSRCQRSDKTVPRGARIV